MMRAACPSPTLATSPSTLVANPDKALDTLAREELGLNPDDLGSPIGAAFSSFVALPWREPAAYSISHRRD